MTYEKTREAFHAALLDHLDELVCAQPNADSDDWFAKPNSVRELSARKRCLDCPIYWECQAYGIEAGVPDGTWGGVDERTRARIWKGMPGGKPTHFLDEMDAVILPALQERRDFENFDINHTNDETEEAA